MTVCTNALGRRTLQIHKRTESSSDSVPSRPPATLTSPSRKRLRRVHQTPTTPTPTTSDASPADFASAPGLTPANTALTPPADPAVRRRLISPVTHDTALFTPASTPVFPPPPPVSSFAIADKRATSLSLDSPRLRAPTCCTVSPVRRSLPIFPRVVTGNPLRSPLSPGLAHGVSTAAARDRPRQPPSSFPPRPGANSLSGFTGSTDHLSDFQLPHLPISPGRQSLSLSRHPTPTSSAPLSIDSQPPARSSASFERSSDSHEVPAPPPPPPRSPSHSASSRADYQGDTADREPTVRTSPALTASSSRRRAREHSFLLESASLVAAAASASRRRRISQRSSQSSFASPHTASSESAGLNVASDADTFDAPSRSEEVSPAQSTSQTVENVTTTTTKPSTSAIDTMSADHVDPASSQPTATVAAVAAATSTDSTASPFSPPLPDGSRRVSFKDRQRFGSVSASGGSTRASLVATASPPRMRVLSMSDSLADQAPGESLVDTLPGSPVGGVAMPQAMVVTGQAAAATGAAPSPASGLSSPNPASSLETSGRKLSFKDRQRLSKAVSTDSAGSPASPSTISADGMVPLPPPSGPRPSLTTTSYRQTQRNSAVAGIAPLVGPPLSLRRKTEQGVLTFGARPAAAEATSSATTADALPDPAPLTRRPAGPDAATLSDQDEADLVDARRVVRDNNGDDDVDDDDASIEEEAYLLSRHASPPASRSSATTTTSQASPLAAPAQVMEAAEDPRLYDDVEDDGELMLAATQNDPLAIDGLGAPQPMLSAVALPVVRPVPATGTTPTLTNVDGRTSDALSPEQAAARRRTMQPSLVPAHTSSLGWDVASSRPTAISIRHTSSTSGTTRERDEDEGRSEGEGHTPASGSTPTTRKNVLSHWVEQEGPNVHLAHHTDGEAHGPQHQYSLSNSSVASSTTASSAIPIGSRGRSPASQSSRAHTFTRMIPSESTLSLSTPTGTPTVGSRRDRGKMLSSTTPRLRSNSSVLAFPQSPLMPSSMARGESPGHSAVPFGGLSASAEAGSAPPGASTDAFHLFNRRIEHLAQDSFDEANFSSHTQPTVANSDDRTRGWTSQQAASHTYDSVMTDEVESTIGSCAPSSCPLNRSPRTDAAVSAAASAVANAALARLAGTANTDDTDNNNSHSFPHGMGSVASSSTMRHRTTPRSTPTTSVPAQVQPTATTATTTTATTSAAGVVTYQDDSLGGTHSSTPTPLSPEVLRTTDAVSALSPYVPSRLLALPTRIGGGGGGGRLGQGTKSTGAVAELEDDEEGRSDGFDSGTMRSRTELLTDMDPSRTDMLGATGRSQTDVLGATTGRLGNSTSVPSSLVASRTNRRTSTFSSLQFSMNRRRPHRQSSQRRQREQQQKEKQQQLHSRSTSTQLLATTTNGELFDDNDDTDGDGDSARQSRRRVGMQRAQTTGAFTGTSSAGNSATEVPGHSQVWGSTLGDASVLVHDGTTSTPKTNSTEPSRVPSAQPPHTIAVPDLSNLPHDAEGHSASQGRDDTDTVREVKGDSQDDDESNPLARAQETLRAMAVDEVLPGEETIGLWSTAEVVFLPHYELLATGETAQETTLRALRSFSGSPVFGESATPAAAGAEEGCATNSTGAAPFQSVQLPLSLSSAGPTSASMTTTMPGTQMGLGVDTDGVFSFGRIAADYYVEPSDKQVRESIVLRTACPSPTQPGSLDGSPTQRPVSDAATVHPRASPLEGLDACSLTTSAVPAVEDDCKIGARLIMNADSGVMLLAPRDEAEKYASTRTAAELEAEIDDDEGGACACDEAFIGKDSRGMDYSRYNAHTLFDHCVCCQRRPASFLCLHCFVAVCPSHVSRHHRHSPGTCTLFLNLLDIMTSFDRIFWCEKCQQFTWKYTEIYDPLVDQLARTRGTYLAGAARDMRCVGYEVRFTDAPEDLPPPQQLYDEEDVQSPALPIALEHVGAPTVMTAAAAERRCALAEDDDEEKKGEAVTAPPPMGTLAQQASNEETNSVEHVSSSQAVSVAGSTSSSSSSSADSELVAPMQEHLVRPKPAELPTNDRVVPLGKAVRRLQGLGCSVQGWRATQEDAEAAFMIDIPALHTAEDNTPDAVAARRERRRKRRAQAEAWSSSGEASPSSSPKRRRRTVQMRKAASANLDASQSVASATAELEDKAATDDGQTTITDDDEETIPMAVFCVFDGHGGDAVAKIAASCFESHLRAAVQRTRPDDIRARALLFYLNTESSHAPFVSPARRRPPSGSRGADGAASSLTGSLTNTLDAGSLGASPSGGETGSPSRRAHHHHHAHHLHPDDAHSAARLLIPANENRGGAAAAQTAASQSSASPEFHAAWAGSPASPLTALPRRSVAHDKSLLLAASPLSGSTAMALHTHTGDASLTSTGACATLSPPLMASTEEANTLLRPSAASPYGFAPGGGSGCTSGMGSPTVVVKMTEENLRRQQHHLKTVRSSGQLTEDLSRMSDVAAEGQVPLPSSAQLGPAVASPLMTHGLVGSRDNLLLAPPAAATGPAGRTSRNSSPYFSPTTANARLVTRASENDVTMPFSPTSLVTGQPVAEPLEPVPAASAMTISEMEMLRSYFASIMEEALLSLDDAISKTPEGYRGDYNCVGCTACIVGITSNFILCANVGDSGAAFYTTQSITPISVTHRLQSETEITRIRAAGYNVINDRIEGMLAVPRALGDFDFKQCGGKGPREQAVSCVPDVTIRPVPSDTERWGVIAACDGVWDTATLHQVHFALTNTPNDLEVATSAADAVLRAKELLRHHRRGPASFLHDITSPPSSRQAETARKRSLTGDGALGSSTCSTDNPLGTGQAVAALEVPSPCPPDSTAESDAEALLGGSLVADFGEEVWYGGIDAQLLTAAAGVFAQCVAPADNEAGIGLDNCSLIIVESRE